MQHVLACSVPYVHMGWFVLYSPLLCGIGGRGGSEPLVRRLGYQLPASVVSGGHDPNGQGGLRQPLSLFVR
eukprot:scaffold257198_cov28-Tisochrysis_lutea.AAC.1